jgi:hypothetical protein
MQENLEKTLVKNDWICPRRKSRARIRRLAKTTLHYRHLFIHKEWSFGAKREILTVFIDLQKNHLSRQSLEIRLENVRCTVQAWQLKNEDLSLVGY